MKVTCPNCGEEFETSSSKGNEKSYDTKRDPLEKTRKILEFLKTEDNWSWIRRIARATEMSPYNVSYLIDKYLDRYLEIMEPEEVQENTGIKMKMIRLKNDDLDVKSSIEAVKERMNS